MSSSTTQHKEETNPKERNFAVDLPITDNTNITTTNDNVKRLNSKKKYIILKIVVISIFVLLFSVLSLAISLQRYILYIGVKNNIFLSQSSEYLSDSDEFHSGAQDLFIETKDNVQIHCAFVPVLKKEAPVIISFLGNGNSTHNFLSNVACNFDLADYLIVSYRGYGRSEGFPSERGIQLDSQAVLDWAIAKYPKNKIIVQGHSLGGAVAIDLASRNPGKIEHLVLYNTFLSLPKLLGYPISYFLFDTWNSEERFNSILRQPNGPKIYLHSSCEDTAVPQYHMTTFRDLCLKQRDGRDCYFESYCGWRVDHNYPSSIEKVFFSKNLS